MAENGTHDGSPREDFNPLHDESGRNGQDDGKMPVGGRYGVSLGGSGSSSMDVDDGQYDYGVTPPATRDEKRRKSHYRADKRHNLRQEKKNEQEQIRTERQRRYHSAAVQAQLGLGQQDEDNYFTSGEIKPHLLMKRKHVSRYTSRNRKQARDFKAESKMDFDGLSPRTLIEVDCANRYYSVSSTEVHSADIAGVHRKQRPSLGSVPSTPKKGSLVETFYEELTTYLKASKKASKKEEPKQTDAVLYQPLDLIWLELQAWRHNTYMDVQDKMLFEKRKCIQDVLTDVLSFRTNIPEVVGHNSDDSMCAGTKHQGLCIYGTVKTQKAALDQVTALLHRLESIEDLYPSTKALGNANSLYLSSDFQHKLSALNVWLNITQDLNNKLKLISKVLYIDRIDDKCWPSLDEVSSDADSDDDATSKLTNPDPNSTNLLRVFSNLSIEELAEDSHSSIYRYYVERTLKKTGLRKLLVRLRDLLHGSLSKARALLQYSDSIIYKSRPFLVSQSSVELTSVPSLLDLSHQMFRDMPDLDSEPSLVEYREQIFDVMQLPSFKPTYMLLVGIPLGVIHECLRLRLEQRPEKEPSLLSVPQLMRECKEVLTGAVMVKLYYREMVSSILSPEDDPNKMEHDRLEDDMRAMLDLYLNYLQTWMLELQHLPEMSKSLKNALEDHWVFTKTISPHIREGEAKAGYYFCRLASHMLRSISDYLDSGMDDCINQLYDMNMNDSMEEDDLDQVEVRQMITRTCRSIRNLFQESRERSSKALGFAKTLRKDLEMAAAFHIKVSHTLEDLLDRLNATNHIMIKAPQSAGYMLFVPHDIAEDRSQILQLLNVTCGREDPVKTDSTYPGSYLLLVKCDASHCSDMSQWRGRSADVDPTADTTIALSHMEVESLLLVVTQSSQLGKQRKEFEKLMGPVVTLVNEHTSCHLVIAESLVELKNASLDLQEKITFSLQQVDEKLSQEDNVDEVSPEKVRLSKLSRETLHHCFSFGFEYNKEVIRLVSGEKRMRMAENLVVFAQLWMDFVLTKCEPGKGCIHRWANHGLDFIMTALDPKILTILYDNDAEKEKFLALKQKAMECAHHLVGERDLNRSNSSSRSSSPFAGIMRVPQHSLSCPECKLPLSPQGRLSTTFHSCPTTPDLIAGGANHHAAIMSDEEGGIVFTVQSGDEEREDRVNKELQLLEQRRTKKLQKSGLIGKVHISRSLQQDYDYRINIRRVNFKWQRGNRIGQGSFGTVYTAVNMETGELMAMKEVKLQPNDHQRIKEIADEIKNCEGIADPYLVKYYGVELHWDEMLIFMEYCAGGTIADVSKVGLTEPMLRQYTFYICKAVSVLHEHGIAHRDIKGANIFLTEKGLKLGDFGSSVKLKENTTILGEFKNVVGTMAYAAPEVITDKGHGRAADIWSLGCVVIEMASGKRPWHELESNAQVMFKVGMGGSPAVPETLSEEGKDFLKHCLVTDPRERWTASQLLDHPFVKVDQENDS